MNFKVLSTSFFLLFASATAHSQSYGTDFRKADSLQRVYRFKEAGELFSATAESCGDSAKAVGLRERAVQCENGENFLRFAGTPEVLAAKTFAARDFFLYYSHLSDSTWMQVPVSLLEPGQTLPDLATAPWKYAAYLPESAKIQFFSSPDASGSWNLNFIEFGADSLWSRPEILSENASSAGDEVLPLLSADGKYLYFSSNGLFGMGGYDLYRCAWDNETKDWGDPENLGFPYSSPADDFLYSDTPDGRFTIFASNRGCTSDSIRIYVTAFEAMPVKKELSDIAEIRRTAELLPSGSMQPAASSEASAPETAAADKGDDRYGDYFAALSALRRAKEQTAALEKRQQRDRDLYSAENSGPGKRDSLQTVLNAEEEELLTLQQKLTDMAAKIQSMEMDFLAEGMILQPVESEGDRAEASQKAQKKQGDGYIFKKMNEAAPREFRLRPKRKEINWSFKIAEQSVVIPVDSIRNGLVYQIHIFNAPADYPLKKLKGLTPVFIRDLQGGKRDFSVGVFHTFDEVSRHLNSVRKLGFKDSYVTAWKDGTRIQVNKARKIEKEQPAATYQVVLGGITDSDEENVRTLIKSNTDKDIVRDLGDGETGYSVGPFTNKYSADSLATVLTAAGIPNVSVKELK